MPGSRSVVLVWLGLAVLAGPACQSSKEKIEAAQKRRDAEKKAVADAAAAKMKASIPKIERAKLEPFWDDPAYATLTTGRPCPEGLWALFPGTPGEGAEKEKNEARRAELAAKVKAQTFVAVHSHGNGVTLRKYNPKKKTLTVEVDGVMECYDGLGLLSVAWGEPAKAFRPKAPDDDEEEALTPQSVWRAQPLLFPLPFPTAAEAKAFAEGPGVGTEVRLVFTLGAVAVDKNTRKRAMPLPDAGAVEDTLDWGAGRLVHVSVLGVRVASDHEKTLLAEKRKP